MRIQTFTMSLNYFQKNQHFNNVCKKKPIICTDDMVLDVENPKGSC